MTKRSLIMDFVQNHGTVKGAAIYRVVRTCIDNLPSRDQDMSCYESLFNEKLLNNKRLNLFGPTPKDPRYLVKVSESGIYKLYKIAK